MTVKCLSDIQKQVVIYQYLHLKLNLNEIAHDAKRSRRTIIRVLEEAGIDVPRRPRKAKTVEPVIVEPVKLEPPELTPMEYFKCLLKAVFRKSYKNAVNQ